MSDPKRPTPEDDRQWWADWTKDVYLRLQERCDKPPSLDFVKGDTVNDIERLHQDLTERFPDRKVDIDPSETATGSWFVTVYRDGGLPPVVVEWNPKHGFGLSAPGPHDFGTGVDEVFPDAKATFDRVVQLVQETADNDNR